ncbi:MAG: DUF5009 domain-containing protein [Bacteroidota bacterium]
MSHGKEKRLVSLDAFRGFTIAGMILVNIPGSWSYVYPPLQHAPWFGCTPTDLVFPFFLFIVGVAMWFSFKKVNYELSGPVVKRVISRAALIFACGLFIRAFPFYNIDFDTFRPMGVLQRIGIAFALGAIVCLYFKRTRPLLIFSAIILLTYWVLLWFFGGPDPYSLENNLVRKVDVFVFGANHLWQGLGIPFDPEGLLSTLPSIISVVLGFLVGQMIDKTPRDQLMIRMAVIGVISLFIGYTWSFVFPLSKSLWTSSYVIYTTGIAIFILGIFVWVIDIKNKQGWAFPLLVFGMNSLFAYILSELWVKTLWTIQVIGANGSKIDAYTGIYQKIMVPIAGNMNGSLLFAVTHIVIFWIILLILYKKRIFIKV